MKRTIIAALFATLAGVAFAGNSQYNNEAGQQDFTAPIAASDFYKNDAGSNDEHQPQVG